MSSRTLSKGLNQSMAFAFSAQNSLGFWMDFSHSCLRFSPEDGCVLFGKNLSLNGKFVSDISFHSMNFVRGKVKFTQYKVFSRLSENKRSCKHFSANEAENEANFQR